MDAPDTPDTHLAALLQRYDCRCTCGYNLRGATGAACPECGAAVDPAEVLGRNGRIDPAWMTLLLSATFALPWSLLGVWQKLLVVRRMFYIDIWYPGVVYKGLGLLTRSCPNCDGQQHIRRPILEIVRMLASYGFWLGIPIFWFALLVWRRRISRWPTRRKWALACTLICLLVLAYRRWLWPYYALGLFGLEPRYLEMDWWWLWSAS